MTHPCAEFVTHPYVEIGTTHEGQKERERENEREKERERRREKERERDSKEVTHVADPIL